MKAAESAAAVRLARSDFCALPFIALGRDDLKTHDDTGLHEHTLKIPLGEADAFVSHSWHGAAAGARTLVITGAR